MIDIVKKLKESALRQADRELSNARDRGKQTSAFFADRGKQTSAFFADLGQANLRVLPGIVGQQQILEQRGFQWPYVLPTPWRCLAGRGAVVAQSSFAPDICCYLTAYLTWC
jgi:hypothetical protein